MEDRRHRGRDSPRQGHPPGHGVRGSGRLTSVGDTLFFVADDGVHGKDVWSSDGTDVGTVLVKDLAGNAPGALTNAGGTLFFAANDGVNGRELWTSDGTDAGTVLLKDIRLGQYSSFPSLLTYVGDSVFFTAQDGLHGEELWSSDGTEAGTVLVKDISSANDGYGPQLLTAVDDRLYFSADDGVHGEELWSSDGTEAGTLLVKDITPKTADYAYGPESFTAVGGTLFFTTDDGIIGQELWTSDGTEAGTSVVSDINKGRSFSVARKGIANTRKGTRKVKVSVDATGRVAVAPVGKSKLRRTFKDSATGKTVTVTLTPTKAGVKKLKRTGKLAIKARFTFTPCGVTGTSVVRSFTLRMR